MKKFLKNTVKNSAIFTLIPFVMLESCKTPQSTKTINKEPALERTTEKAESGKLNLTQEEGEIAAISSLSGVSVLSVYMAAQSLKKPSELKSGRSAYNQKVMEAFKGLSADQKRLILQENVNRLKELRAMTGKTEKIKVMVIGAPGGSGHRSAGDSMKKILSELPGGEDLFEVKYVEPFPFSTDKWNQLAREGRGEELAEMAKYRPYAEAILDNPFGRKYVKSKMLEAMKNPDVVIQAEHIGTKAMRAITEDLGAQHRLVPTDFALEHFLMGIKKVSPDSLDFRIDAPISGDQVNQKFLDSRGIKNAVATGYPVRWEILDLAERLRSLDQSVRLKAEGEVKKVISDLSGDTFAHGKDRSIFVMMGGLGTTEEAMKQYVETVVKGAGQLAPEDGKVHLFMAQAEGFKENIDALYKELARQSPELAGKVQVHSLGRVSATEVGSFMNSGITFTKAGGGSIAELATMGGNAVFDIRLSKWLEWEKFNYEMFERNKWGYAIQDNSDPEEIVGKMKQAFLDRTNGRSAKIANQFHLDWPQAVLSDLISKEKQALFRQHGKFYMEDAGWGPGAKENKKVIDLDVEMSKASPGPGSKIVGGTAIAIAVASALAAAGIATPEETKEELKNRLAESLKLTDGNSKMASCEFILATGKQHCITWLNYDQTLLRNQCENLPEGSLSLNKQCDQTIYPMNCQINSNLILNGQNIEGQCALLNR